jgi:hypothetical protein
MTREALHRREIRPSVEKMGDEGAPKIVRGESFYPSFDSSLPENVEHGLVRHPARDHPTRLVDRAKKGSGFRISNPQPGLQRRPGSVRRIDDPLLAALPGPDAEFAGLRGVVGEFESDSLGSTKASTVEDGEECCVPSARRSRILPASDKQRS